jgi:uncharacterized protein YegP (UPF0339 family)
MQGTSNFTAYVYQDRAGEWRWRVRSINGEIVAVSGEGYVNRSHAISMVESLFPEMTVVLPEIEGQGTLF